MGILSRSTNYGDRPGVNNHTFFLCLFLSVIFSFFLPFSLLSFFHPFFCSFLISFFLFCSFFLPFLPFSFFFFLFLNCVFQSFLFPTTLFIILHVFFFFKYA